MFTKFCAALSKISLVLAVIGLLSVVLCVQWQVIGRYVFNDTPTWAEALAMLIVLFVTAFGLGVGVRDAGHIGMESLIVLLPEKWRLRLELLIHSLEPQCQPMLVKHLVIQTVHKKQAISLHKWHSQLRRPL